MGIYVYNVRRSGAKKATLNGTPVEVFTCKFTCRYSALPSQQWSSWDRKNAFPYDLVFGRIERAWGDAKPVYVRLDETDTVYLWTGGLTWIDCDKLPGTPVGKLVKRGRQWAIEPVLTNPNEAC